MKKNGWDIFYDVLFRPQEAFQSFNDQAPLKLAALTVIAAAVLPPAVAWADQTEDFLNVLFGVLFFGEVTASLLFWIIGAGFFHFIAELLGGRGRMLALLSALGFAHLPRLAVLPFWALGGLLPGGLSTLWLVLTGIMLAIWSVYLYYYAIRATYSLSGSQAILVFCSPIIIGVLLILALVLFCSIWVTQIPFL